VCVAVGGNCSANNAQCHSGSFCNFTSDICVPLHQIGQNCSTGYQCEGGDIGNTDCYQGTCQQITMTAEEGEWCNDVHDCKTPLYCNNSYPLNGTCLKGVEIGGNCSDLPCAAGTCNLGVCINFFTVPEGGACDQDFAFGLLVEACSPGLYCNWSNANENGTCVKGFSSSNAPCNFTCANPAEMCSCWDNSQNSTCRAPTVTSQSQANNFKSLMNCITAASCNPQDPSCCSNHKCTVYDIMYQNRGDDLTFCGGSNPYSSCGASGWDGLSTPEKVGIIAVAAAIVVVVTVVVACCCLKRKKHHYSQI